MGRRIRHRMLEKHLDKKLKNRMRWYFVLSFLLLGVVGYEILFGMVTVGFALLGVVMGIFLGVGVARMFHLSWDHDAKKIVSRLDAFGIVILVLYIAFVIVRRQIIGYFFYASMVGGMSMAISAGVMIGRVVGTRGKILKILKEQRVFR